MFLFFLDKQVVACTLLHSHPWIPLHSMKGVSYTFQQRTKGQPILYERQAAKLLIKSQNAVQDPTNNYIRSAPL